MKGYEICQVPLEELPLPSAFPEPQESLGLPDIVVDAPEQITVTNTESPSTPEPLNDQPPLEVSSTEKIEEPQGFRPTMPNQMPDKT